jgi:hypothetical protein
MKRTIGHFKQDEGMKGLLNSIDVLNVRQHGEIMVGNIPACVMENKFIADELRIDKIEEVLILAEQGTYPHKQPSRLMKIRDLTPDTEGPVRILCIIIQSKPGFALVQDLLHDKVDDAKVISVLVEGKLKTNEKYILIGDVTERKSNGEKTLVFSVSLAHNVDKLDVAEFKETIILGQKVEDALSR